MSAKRTLRFTSQGFRTQEIEIAPDAEEPRSKRNVLIEEEDSVLNSNLVGLDIGTRARNRAFQDRIDEIWRSTEAWEAKLKTETKEAVESILNLKDEYRNHMQVFSDSLQAEIKTIFDRVDNVVIEGETDRVEVMEKDIDVFVKQIVPDEIEKQSGEVSRQLRRAYETFDIEKQKEHKRETKLIQKCNRHLQNTAQRFEDEYALMDSCFYNLEDDIVEHERRAARLHLLRNDTAQEQLVALNLVSSTEARVRQEEDVEVLDTLIETQKLLQQTVVLHFGTRADEVTYDESSEEPKNPETNGGDSRFPTMKRLNHRMEKVREHQAVAAAKAEEDAARVDDDPALAAGSRENADKGSKIPGKPKR